MTKEELAKMISGREYAEEITPQEAKIAKESGLIVIYGASDDLLEFDGAIRDEASGYEGIECDIMPNGKLFESVMANTCGCSEWDDKPNTCKLFQEWKSRQKLFHITAKWCPPELKCSWLISISGVPAASFDIMEDGELYCRGIVIDLKDIK